MINKKDTVCILGGGLSALAFAYFFSHRAVIYEKENRLGGLCRSFEVDKVMHDIGPHIFFSKDKKTLEFLLSLTKMHKLKRANRIWYKGGFIRYPFENDLGALPEEDKKWCLETFLDNPYQNLKTADLLSFFYKNFGEGITKSFLEPYNRKIWKFNPSLMDTQMVERIPLPPAEDIIASARGMPTEGYLHQLYFSYPDIGGTESIIHALKSRCDGGLETHLNSPLHKLQAEPDGTFIVSAGEREERFTRVISTIPVHELIPRLEPVPPKEIEQALAALKYNSIHITTAVTRKDKLADYFAIMIPQPDISFHRISKLDFLGDNYRQRSGTTLMTEITFRPGDRFDLSPDEISKIVKKDLEKLGFISPGDIKRINTKSFKYGYVIYDLEHRKKIDKILAWLNSLGIVSIGRFARFEYINMNTAVKQAREMAEYLTGSC